MPPQPKKDNSTFNYKVALRQAMLKRVSEPVVMETHGGAGKIFQAVYADVRQGIVFDTDAHKTELLAIQRPTWAVYEGDCAAAIAHGVGADLPINVLDVDPYGEPWPVLEAFFSSERERPHTLCVVVNDGLRQKLQRFGAWDVESMTGMVARYGNKFADNYLQVCKELITEKATQAGYRLERFAGYYCGHANQMTHYLAMFQRG